MSEAGEPLEPDAYTPTEEALSAFACLFAFILTTILTIFHASKWYSDLYTKDRNAVKHRRKPPSLTKGYKLMAHLTFVSVFFYFLTLFAAVIQYTLTIGKCSNMLTLSIIDKIGYWGCKGTLYVILVVRLHEVYGNSSYGYGETKLKCIAGFIVGLSITILLVKMVFISLFPVYIDDTDDTFPFFCQIQWKLEYLQIIGGVMVLFDIVASIGSMLAFIIPLNKVIKECNKYDGNKNNKTTNAQKRYAKMMYTGYKYKILVMVAAFSTLFWIVLLIIGLPSLATIFGQLDFFINPLCLVLMTAYYPSDKYYERICCLCIRCCDRKGVSYQSKSSEAHDESEDPQKQGRPAEIDSTVAKSDIETVTTTVGPSVDTDVAIQVKIQEKDI